MKIKIQAIYLTALSSFFLISCAGIITPKSLTEEQLKNLQEAKDLEHKRQQDFADAWANCNKIQWSKKNAYIKQKCLNNASEINPAPLHGWQASKALHTAYLSAALDYSEGKISQERFFLIKEQSLLRIQEYENQNRQLELQAQIQQQQASNLEKSERWNRFRQALDNYSNQLQEQQNQAQQQQFQQQMFMQQNRVRTTNCHSFGNNLNCTTF